VESRFGLWVNQYQGFILCFALILRAIDFADRLTFALSFAVNRSGIENANWTKTTH
jgi:hypothetical protein